MALMNMVASLNLAMDDALREDDTVILLGEDIGQDEGVFRVTAKLLEKYGENRVLDTPLAESAIVGGAVGLDRWIKLDPIPRFQKYLKKRGVADQKMLDEIDADIKAEIETAVERYEAGRSVDPLDCFDYTYETLPAELREQRDEYKAALEREGLAKQA